MALEAIPPNHDPDTLREQLRLLHREVSNLRHERDRLMADLEQQRRVTTRLHRERALLGQLSVPVALQIQRARLDEEIDYTERLAEIQHDHADVQFLTYWHDQRDEVDSLICAWEQLGDLDYERADGTLAVLEEQRRNRLVAFALQFNSATLAYFALCLEHNQLAQWLNW